MKPGQQSRYNILTSEEDPLKAVPKDLLPLLPAFMERRRLEVIDLKNMLLESNYSGMSDLGHKLKGVGLGFGFGIITELGAALEDAASNRNRTKIIEIVKNLAVFVGTMNFRMRNWNQKQRQK